MRNNAFTFGFRRWTVLLLLLFFCILPVPAKRLKVGLVLGGGGAKGAAEVGVIKVLQKSGIPIDYVAGTSIGSLVGGLYAAGVSAEEMEKLFMRQDWISLFTDRNVEHKSDPFYSEDGCYFVFGYPIYNSNRSMLRDGLLRGDSITSLLGQLTGQRNYIHFDKLKTPFRCVAVDLETMSEVVLEEGVLPECLRASMSFPVAFTTQMRDGRKLIDGGAVNNFPVDVVKQMGADIVIAIDLQQEHREKPSALQRFTSGVTDFIDDLTSGIDVGGIVNTLVGQPDFIKNQQVNFGKIAEWFLRHPDDKKYEKNKEMVDVYINPDLRKYTIMSFTPKQVKQMIRLGEKSCLKALPQLEEVMKRVYLSVFGL